VTILRRGEVVVEGNIEQLLQRDATVTDVLLFGEGVRCERFVALLQGSGGAEVVRQGETMRVAARGDAAVSAVLRAALESEMRVAEVVPRRETLEDLFVARAFDTEQPIERAAQQARGANA
jgi:ABC-type multidrug transport system ATPase subunit